MQNMLVRSSSIRRIFGFLIISVVFVIIICICVNYVKNTYETDFWANSRCVSEMNSLKYQLDEYKNRLDKLLTETQQKCDFEKERFKEIMDSYLAMQQQTSICQSQFEDLQSECKKAKELSDMYKKEMEKLKPAR